MALVSPPPVFIGALAEAEMWLETTDFETRSLPNAKRQVISYPSASHWRVSIRTTLQDIAGARQWRAFLLRLQGRSNWFQCPVPMFVGAGTGYAGPNALVNGAGQTGTQLVVDGITPSAPYLLDGDWFTVADQLFCAVGNVTANASGQATINLNKPLRASPANNAPLNHTAPYFLCAAAAPSPARWRGADLNRKTFSFDGAEHIA